MKKGFTLIEVLAVVVVLSAVFAIVVPKINQSINARNDAEYTELVASIENAAKLYVSDNYLIGTDPTPRYLTMEDLVENNYLPYPIKDPRDNENFNLLAIILVTEDEDGVLEYKFSIDNIFPVVNSITKTSSTSYEPYLKIGDTLTVNIVFNKTIANTPTVTIGGYNATVSGNGTTRTASLVVPSGYALNGYFTVVVSNYEDVNGVIGEPTTYSTNVTPYLAMFNTATPVASSFTIGSGNPTYSKTTGVTLYMSATNALQMCISTSTTCTAWETYATTKTYTLATGDGTKTLYVKFRNSALEEVSANDSIVLDATAPVCTTTYTSPAGYDGTAWTKNDVTITGTCTDALSGCVTASSSYPYTVTTNTTTAGPGTNGAAWTATDNAGNSSTCLANKIVKVDKIAPTCINSGGSTTWFNTDRTITGTCSDTGGSTCSAATVTKLYSTPINSTTESPGTVTDIAGNSTVCLSDQIVKIDKTNPTCATSGGSSTWINTSRTITGTCHDTEHATVNSGCTGNISYVYNPAASTIVNITNGGPGVSGAAGTVSDNAGNSVTCAADQTVKIDKVLPPATAHNPVDRAWGTAAISIALSATDVGSEIAGYEYCSTTNGTTCTPATAGGTVALSDTGQYTVCSRAKDNAGNTGPTTCSAANAYKIDKAVPAVASISRSGVYYYTVAAGTDTGGSGVQKVTYALSGAIVVAETTYSTAVTINTLGTTTITSYTYDNANNKSSAATASVIVAAATCTSGSASGTAPNVKCTYAASGGYYYCNSGTLSGSECYTSASGGYYYCTPSSLQLSGDQCYWDADYISFYCPSGGTLSGGTCYITDTTTASCPSGYTESGSTCSKTTSSTVTQTANRENVCVCETSGWDCGYSTPSFSTCSGTAGSITYGTCSPTKPSTCNSSIYGIPYSCTASCSRSCTTYSTTTTNPVCPSGYSRSGWTCTRTTSYAASGDYYQCPDGSIRNGTTCHYAAQYQSYYCSNGWYISGSNCYTNADYQDYYCPSDGSLSGTTCSLNRSCSSGYTYAAATDKCYK